MTYKKKLLFALGLTIILFLIGLILTEPVAFGLCEPAAYSSCLAITEYTGQPLGIISLVASIILLMFLFIRQEVSLTCLKVHAFLFPLLIAWIVYTPAQCRAPLGLCFDRELTTLTSAGILLLVTAGVLAWKYYTLRKQRRQSP